MLRRAGNVALAYQELCGQVSLKKMLCEQHQRWRKEEAGVLSGTEFKWGQNFFLLKRLSYLNNKWQCVHRCQGLLKGNQAGLSKIGTKGFELFSVINNSELSTANSCKSHLCFYACEQSGFWIDLLWSEFHSILKKKKKKVDLRASPVNKSPGKWVLAGFCKAICNLSCPMQISYWQFKVILKKNLLTVSLFLV